MSINEEYRYGYSGYTDYIDEKIKIQIETVRLNKMHFFLNEMLKEIEGTKMSIIDDKIEKHLMDKGINVKKMVDELVHDGYLKFEDTEIPDVDEKDLKESHGRTGKKHTP